jgi:UDP-N-acetylmuramoylalanine--D-glutamate ligase
MPSPYGKNIHVVGFAGAEGAALLQYLHRKFPGQKITAHDSSDREHFFKNFRDAHIGLSRELAKTQSEEILALENVSYCFRDQYLQGIDQADTIFVPQSWFLYSENEPLKPFAEKFRSITRLYFDLFPGKIIGVTGSNGKTTTTSMIAEIMQRAFPTTLFSGNDRRNEQVLDRLELAKKEDWLVLEISNRQLMIDLGKSPDISVITNITPNHLSEHGGFEAYRATKLNLIKYQKPNQWSVLNQDDPESRQLIATDEGETLLFSTEEPLPRGVFVEFDHIVIKHGAETIPVMAVKDFPLLGKHNLSNALAAVAATYLAGVNVELIAQTLRSLDPVPQRMELVKTVAGVEYYNDSASTAPESTIAAIETLKKPGQKLFLILGGKSKGLNYEKLATTIANNVTATFFLKSPLVEDLKSMEKIACETLQEAVQLAHERAKAGDRVLFSPASEYFVYFKDKMPGYKNFRDIVERM